MAEWRDQDCDLLLASGVPNQRGTDYWRQEGRRGEIRHAPAGIVPATPRGAAWLCALGLLAGLIVAIKTGG